MWIFVQWSMINKINTVIVTFELMPIKKSDR